MNTPADRSVSSLRLPAFLGLAHGVADGAAGLLLGSLPMVTTTATTTGPGLSLALLVLFYNALAFGSQPFVGSLADSWNRPRAFAVAGLGLLAAALPLALWLGQPTWAVLLAGVGAAGFHVGAGALTLRAANGRAAEAGLFAAPGVLGLALGGTLALGGHALAALPAFLLALLAFAAALAMGSRFEPTTAPERSPPPASAPAAAAGAPVLETHDWLMLLLLSAIALRSAVWTTLEFALQGRTDLLLALALAAAVGKVGGGFLAERLGWRRWAVGALGLASLLLTWGGANPRRPGMVLLGVALLQSTTPVTLAAIGRLLPTRPATAAGLTLGLAVALGGVPSLLGFPAAGDAHGPTLVSTLTCGLCLLLGAGALAWAMRPADYRPLGPRTRA